MNEAWNALSDPTRRKILTMLRKSDLNAGEIASQFEMSKPSISHHLSILKQADLVTTKKVGQNMIYSINTSVLEDILNWFSGMIGKDKPL